MKKIFYILLVTGFTLAAISIASHQFRYEFYQFAIQLESDKAELTPKHSVVNHQNYYYLSRNHDKPSETVVLLHGFSANKENWLRFSQNVPANYQIFALDLLGHGEHAIDLNANYNIESQVEYLHTFIKNTINRPVHIIGNSMGGAVASIYSAKYPKDVKTLMLISPAGVHDIPSEMDTILETGTNPLIAKTIEQFYDVIDFVMEDHPFIPDSILLVEAEKSVSRYDLNHKIFADLRSDLNKGLDQNFAQIQVPTLIVWGQQDRVINAKNIQHYSQLIANSASMILNEVGHLAMIETPEVVAHAFIKLSSTPTNATK